MDEEAFQKEFGDSYKVNKNTREWGIHPLLGRHVAERFKDMVVLETCTGGGFTTIELAKVAKKVITVEINPEHSKQAEENMKMAGVYKNITFLVGDILNEDTLEKIPPVDAAIMDPWWNDDIIAHMHPPADRLLTTIRKKTENMALFLSPDTDLSELGALQKHELERVYLNGEMAFYCLYFGSLMRKEGETEFRARSP